MRLALLFICVAAIAQNRPVREVPAQAVGPVGLAFVRENYTKFEYRIPMRDGVKLFTAVYVPKDVASDGHTYPIMMTRTPYSVRPYGVDQYPASSRSFGILCARKVHLRLPGRPWPQHE